MAKTLRYTDVLDVAGKGLPKRLEDNFASMAANSGTNLVWYAYDWRESLKVLPPFYLVAGEQDHTIPPAIVPTDFHGLRKAVLSRYTQGAITKMELDVIRDLFPTHIKAVPNAISYEPSVSGFRVHPRVPDNVGAPEWFIEGTYKCRPTLITNSTLSTLLPFDDMYFNVQVEAVRWAMLMLSGSPNAGTTQVQNGATAHTGQLATAISFIEMMAAQEGINSGDINIHPAEPLVAGGGGIYSLPSLYGLYG